MVGRGQIRSWWCAQPVCVCVIQILIPTSHPPMPSSCLPSPPTFLGSLLLPHGPSWAWQGYFNGRISQSNGTLLTHSGAQPWLSGINHMGGCSRRWLRLQGVFHFRSSMCFDQQSGRLGLNQEVVQDCWRWNWRTGCGVRLGLVLCGQVW
ncbi:hypothetical protein EDB87DRAFT_727724 [Lactarius vividus]|nr:hypothetical protein EDB87DRAFT_727724 [Lactarius vividus]